MIDSIICFECVPWPSIDFMDFVQLKVGFFKIHAFGMTWNDV